MDEKNVEKPAGGGQSACGWRRDPLFWAGAVLLASALVGLTFITANMTLYSDDYLYSTFFTRGPEYLWEMLTWHYFNFNGRTFIHIMAEITLIWGTKLFIILEPAMLVCLFGLGCRVQNRETPWGMVLLMSGVGIWLTLALPAVWLKESLFWISSAYNYLFPVSVLMIALWLYQRLGERGRGLAPLLILSFLAGATTEQCGLAAFVCLFGWGALCWLRKSMPLWKGLLPSFLAGVGYLTVVFAPGTWVRVDHEVNAGLLAMFSLDVFPERLKNVLNYFIGAKSVPWVFLGFALLTVLHRLVTKRGSRLLLLGVPAALLYALFRQMGHPFIAGLTAVCYLILAAVLYLLRQESTARGLLVLAALASQLVMIVPGQSAYRTAVPAVLLLLAVGVSLIGECLELCPPIPRIAPAVLAAVLCFVLYLPTCRGYLANGVIHRKNEQALREKKDIITLDVGADNNYQHIFVFYTSPSYLGTVKELYGITDEKITYENASWPVAGSYNGHEAGMPICIKDEKPYGSMVNVAQMLGGDGEWNYENNGTLAWVGDTYYLVKSNGQVWGWDKDAWEPTVQMSQWDVWVPWYTHYLPLEALGEMFGIEYEYNAEENIYYISKDGNVEP